MHTGKMFCDVYYLTYIINHLRVSVASATIMKVLYKNNDKVLTNCQTAYLKPTDITVIISSATYGCKMPDYVLLKTARIYIVAKNKYSWVCSRCLYVACSWYTPC
jgi:hypothetical protein